MHIDDNQEKLWVLSGVTDGIGKCAKESREERRGKLTHDQLSGAKP